MSAIDAPHEHQATPLSQEDLAAIARAQEILKSHGYAILKPFAQQDDYSAGQAPSVPENQLKILMVIDFEATGIDPNVAIPIEIGFVRVQFDPHTGTIHKVLERYNGLEDPGEPLTPEIVKITGITDEDVKGQRFDDAVVNKAIASSDLVIAHNASYDRVLGERRFPDLVGKQWACSLKEGPWDEMTIGTKKQEFLAFKIAGLTYGAHRAMADCEVLLHILSSPGLEGKTCFATVMERAYKPTYTVWAVGSPFDSKDALKKDGAYRWSGDDPNKLKGTWYKEGLSEDGLKEQLAFLYERVYRRPVNITVDEMNASDRYSMRHTRRSTYALKAPVKADQGSESDAQEAPAQDGREVEQPSAPPSSRSLGFRRR